MRVMPADYDAPTIGYWAALYPDKVGWLIGPTSRRKYKTRPWLPFACDNDRYIAFSKGSEWNEAKYWEMLSFYRQTKQTPLWVLVPDVVGNRTATLESWYHFYPKVSEFGWPLAFAVQDGMTPLDVPAEADVVFVGGTTGWKWKNAAWFCKELKRVHVGRVNTMDRLWLCHDMGAESVDGTGWFMHGELNWGFQKLERYFKGERDQELKLNWMESEKGNERQPIPDPAAESPRL